VAIASSSKNKAEAAAAAAAAVGSPGEQVLPLHLQPKGAQHFLQLLPFGVALHQERLQPAAAAAAAAAAEAEEVKQAERQQQLKR
jgi:hypothetical protein